MAAWFFDRLGKRRSPVAPASEGVQNLPVDQITPNPYQPRKEFNAQELEGLSQSIAHLGVVQPVIVRRRVNGYELVAGERRLRAARLAGLKRIPAIVRKLSDPDMLEVAFVENLQRKELNSAEIAESFKRLSMEFESTGLDELGRRLGADVRNMISALWIIKLHPAIRKALIRELIDEPRARMLSEISDEDAMYMALERVYRDKLSVQATRRLVDRIKSETDLSGDGNRGGGTVRPRASDPEQVALCMELLRELLISFRQAGVPVRIRDLNSAQETGLKILFSKSEEP